MPRPRAEGAPEPKRRSRHGCWPCKHRKIKCGEEKPECLNCHRQGEKCDYSIRLNWEGRGKKRKEDDYSTVLDGGSSSPQFSNATIQPTSAPSSNSGHQYAAAQGVYPSPASPYSSDTHLSPTISYLDSPRSSGMYSISGDLNQISPGPASLSPPRGAHLHLTGGTDADHSAKKRRVLPPPSTSNPIENYQFMQDERQGQRASPQMSSYSLPRPSNIPNPMPSPRGLSSVGVEGFQPPPTTAPGQSFNDARRLSVRSLLANPDPIDAQNTYSEPSETMYGYDQGRIDEDMPKNDDTHALEVMSPSKAFRTLSPEGSFDGARPGSRSGYDYKARGREHEFESGGYYAQPVAVKISKSLEPLPSMLIGNPMNLLYFHHFMNHTGKILVAHECPENPYSTILPQMAVQDDNLLNIFLAYAASHRARLLNQTEPVNRIAEYVANVFPAMLEAVQTGNVSTANVATAVMLGSLQIISPDAFGVHIPWQKQLGLAKRMIMARGGYNAMRNHDKESEFLIRWFCYLDVLGSLGDPKYESALVAEETEIPEAGRGEDGEDSIIECLFGFTNACLRSLAHIGKLAKKCDRTRIDFEKKTVNANWEPPADIVEIAEIHKASLLAPRPTMYKGCAHVQVPNADLPNSDSNQLIAINDSHHWAGLIHLYTRVLGRPISDGDVQIAVGETVQALHKVGNSGAAEACMLFPMFTAGAVAKGPSQRETIIEKLHCVEHFGMTHIKSQIDLLKEIWRTNQPWETVVNGDFFG